jgi:hypothetical protein
MSDTASPRLNPARFRSGLSAALSLLSALVAAASVLLVLRFVQISTWSLPGGPDTLTMAMTSLSVSLFGAIGCVALTVAVSVADSPSHRPKRVASRAAVVAGLVTLACAGWVASLLV